MKLLQAYDILLVTFFSLTATSIAVLNYAKPGCNDTCGKVRIPYPFGIGANCSINEWYNINCKSSTPYLSAVNYHLEVLSVHLVNQTVTVNMPNVRTCSQTSESVDLGGSPFLYSKSQNKFVVEGCGNGVILGDHGSVLTGCSTTCDNHTTTTAMDRNSKCHGINCCETTIPLYLNSYSVNLTGLERLDGDRACGSAFLVDKNSYEEVRFSGKSFIPTSLLWTLGYPDLKQVNCCITAYAYKDSRTLDLSNGTSVDTLKCWSNYKPLNGNPYLLDGCHDTEECARCKGNGTGYCRYEETYDIDGLFNKWSFTCYNHDGDHSSLYYMVLSIGTIGAISLGPVFVAAIIYALYKLIKKKRIRRRRKNVFKAYHVLLVIFLSLTTTSIAYSNYAKPGCNDTCGNVRIPYPFGIGVNCSVNEWYIVECNSSTPYLSALRHHLEVLGVDLENQTIAVNMQKFSKSSENKKVDLGKSPFLLLKSYNKVMDDPMSLLWTLSDHDKDQVSCCDNYNPRGYRRIVDIGNGTSLDTWKCAYYEFYEGTPYLRDGCNDYPTVMEECARCEDSDGYCHYDTIYDVDGLVYSQNFTCGYYGDNNVDESRSRKTSMGVLIGDGISMGSLFLAAIIYASYKLIKKTRTRRRKESVSKHTNGTLLLKQQEEAKPSVADQMSLFISCEGEGHRLL